MKALVYEGPHKVKVREVEDAKVVDLRDAVLRVTSAAICGSDLHMYDGRTGVEKGTVLGHEIMGVIEEVGDAVHSIRKGDRVVLPFNIACGACFNCARGFTSACLVTNGEHAGASYGYASMGPYRGGQAQYVRVPFADFNCIKLPGEAGDEQEDDFLMLADIFPTGYHATDLAKVEPGTSVAIYGAGPVGLLAAHSAVLRGAASVFVVDESEVRLAKAQEFGAKPINLRDGDPCEQIKQAIAESGLFDALLPEERSGKEKLEGVMCGIDAVGYQARNVTDPSQEDSTAVLNQLAQLVNPTGAIGIIGVYLPEDSGGESDAAQNGVFPLPLGTVWNKGLTIGMGQTPVKHLSLMLRDLIISGRANPGAIVSHHIGLEDVPEAYRMFDLRGTGEGAAYTKIVINP